MEQYDFVYRINVRAVVASFQHAVPLLEKQGGGVIINPYAFESALATRGARSLTGQADATSQGLAAIFNPSGIAGKGSEMGEFLVELLKGKHPQYASGANIALDAEKDHFPVAETLAKAAAKAATADN